MLTIKERMLTQDSRCCEASDHRLVMASNDCKGALGFIASELDRRANEINENLTKV